MHTKRTMLHHTDLDRSPLDNVLTYPHFLDNCGPYLKEQFGSLAAELRLQPTLEFFQLYQAVEYAMEQTDNPHTAMIRPDAHFVRDLGWYVARGWRRMKDDYAHLGGVLVGRGITPFEPEQHELRRVRNLRELDGFIRHGNSRARTKLGTLLASVFSRPS